jgi:DNA-binding MarR family transcriptional regulator
MAGPPDDAPAAPLWESIDGFERLLEHRTRLGICVLLSRHQTLTFTRLRELLTETDGSLGAHLGKLESAGYLEVEKSFADRRPVTWYRLTAAGRRGLDEHLAALAEIVRAAEPEGERTPEG